MLPVQWQLCLCSAFAAEPCGGQAWQQPLPGLGLCGMGPASHQGARAWQLPLLSLGRFWEVFNSIVTSEPSLAGSRMPGQVCQATMDCACTVGAQDGMAVEAELAEPISKSAFPGRILCAWRCLPDCSPGDLQRQPALWCLLEEQGTGQDFRRALVLCGSTRLEGDEEYQLPDPW